jgi:hypothetical protein
MAARIAVEGRVTVSERRSMIADKFSFLPQRVSKKASCRAAEIPQGLKPFVFWALFGTTEVVPCYKTSCQSRPE